MSDLTDLGKICIQVEQLWQCSLLHTTAAKLSAKFTTVHGCGNGTINVQTSTIDTNIGIEQAIKHTEMFGFEMTSHKKSLTDHTY